jgi:cytochrome c oxidase subunit 2
VNTTVRFIVTSSDVNHAFGVYAPDGKMLGVVQAMPGYHNKVDIDLKQVGKYHVWCLELCGIDHDRMTRDFSVVGS